MPPSDEQRPSNVRQTTETIQKDLNDVKDAARRVLGLNIENCFGTHAQAVVNLEAFRDLVRRSGSAIPERRCDGCRKVHAEVKKLIQLDGCMICDGCIGLLHDIVTEPSADNEGLSAEIVRDAASSLFDLETGDDGRDWRQEVGQVRQQLEECLAATPCAGDTCPDCDQVKGHAGSCVWTAEDIVKVKADAEELSELFGGAAVPKACETVGHWSGGSISIHLDINCDTHRAWVLARRPSDATPVRTPCGVCDGYTTEHTSWHRVGCPREHVLRTGEAPKCVSCGDTEEQEKARPEHVRKFGCRGFVGPYRFCSFEPRSEAAKTTSFEAPGHFICAECKEPIAWMTAWTGLPGDGPRHRECEPRSAEARPLKWPNPAEARVDTLTAECEAELEAADEEHLRRERGSSCGDSGVGSAGTTKTESSLGATAPAALADDGSTSTSGRNASAAECPCYRGMLCTNACAAARSSGVDPRDAVLSRLATWTHEFGAALKPNGADTYGEGVRDCKAQVASLLSVLSGGGGK